VVTLYKRHQKDCKKTDRLKGFTKKDHCDCPIWIEGMHGGKYHRYSLKTNSKAEAERKKQQLEDGKHTIEAALQAFIRDCEAGISTVVHSANIADFTITLPDSAKGQVSVVFPGLGGNECRAFLFRFSWKWRKCSPIKIMERTHEEATEALYAGRESRHPEAASVGAGSDLRIM
jgi:hypothetical protein